MGVLSKMLFCRINRKNWERGGIFTQSGFNLYYGDDPRDTHYWCEDRYGKVYDPSPLAEFDLQRVGLERVYLPWDNQKQRIEEYGEEAWKGFFKGNPRLKDTPEERKAFAEELFRLGDYHTRGGCHLNAVAFSAGRPDLKVVIGSFGYKSEAGRVDLIWGA